MMKITIDVEATEPLYLQIVRAVKQQLAAGDLAPGERLPPVRDVARENGVNFNTVARAYRMLEDEGWLFARQGRGTFLSSSLPDADQKNIRQQQSRRLTRRYVRRMRDLGCSREEIMQQIKATSKGNQNE